MAAEIKLACVLPNRQSYNDTRNVILVTPGDVISSESCFMRGHGTMMENDSLRATVAGTVHRINELISVRPLKARYLGEISDVIVGRIIEVGMKRWKVEVHSKLDAVLLLSSVNLPGGELRRRSEEDERMMRDYLKEGDLISAEVQNIMSDGTLMLHTRSLKYGKLGQGTMIQVPASLVIPRKTHFHTLPGGVQLILGNNGFVWVYPTALESNSGSFQVDMTPVTHHDRKELARVGNCILALAEKKVALFDTSIMYAYEESLKYDEKQILKSDITTYIAENTCLRLEQMGL